MDIISVWKIFYVPVASVRYLYKNNSSEAYEHPYYQCVVLE